MQCISIYLKSDRHSNFKKLRSNFAAAVVYRTISDTLQQAQHTSLAVFPTVSERKVQYSIEWIKYLKLKKNKMADIVQDLKKREIQDGGNSRWQV